MRNPDFEDEEEYLEEEVVSRPRKSYTVAVLWVLVIVSVLVLGALVVICLPFFTPPPENAIDGDPESMLHSSHMEVENELMAEPILEAEVVPEVTEEPTIPPEANPYNQYDFQFNRDNYLICQKQDSYPGIDVSAFQGKIDWKEVASSGIRFAMVRLGFRGYGAAGKMVEDEYAKTNLKGAQKAGLAVGAYFFSQARNIKEVDEEIEFLLKILGDTELNMPLVLDWEVVNAEGRTKGVDRRTLTDCLLHFCQVMEGKGYQPMVYFNWGQSSRMLYLNELEDYPFWLALYQDRMTYPFRVEMWQYTCKGRVPGIQGDVDIDVYIPDLRAK